MRRLVRSTLLGILITSVTVAFFGGLAAVAFAVTFKPDRKIVYSEIDGIELELNLFEQQGTTSAGRPTILFYHGGAWTSGSPMQFYPWAKHFASLGWLAISAEYRVSSKHGTNAFHATDDARNAYRYLHEHATELGIDPQRIVLSGASAGGHLAAAMAIISWPDGNPAPPPAALALLNPALDTVFDGGSPVAPLFEGRGEEISPAHHVQAGLPPTFIVHGTQDSLVPITGIRDFCRRMEYHGNDCSISEHKGEGHGFWNWGMGNSDQVLAEIVSFSKDF